MSNEWLQQLQLKSGKINQSTPCINDASLVVRCRVLATLANKNKNFERNIFLLIVQNKTDLIQNQMMDAQVQIPETIPIAVSNFNIQGEIDILSWCGIF